MVPACQQLGWSFTGRVRGCISFRLDGEKKWMKISELEASGQPVCVGHGVLSRKPRTPCYGRFYLHRRPEAGRHGKGGMPKTQREHRSSAREPWLLFSNAEGLEPHQIMALYSRRMQIEQNFRDDKSPRFGFGLRLSGAGGKRTTGSTEYGGGDGKSGDVAGRLQGRKTVLTQALSGKQRQA
ncbi:transposase [Enterobacter hormaechei]|uniref:transposase n=1 Tax=Enterobacter hormaechei TaxID=158836 RepID=UPI0038904744